MNKAQKTQTQNSTILSAIARDAKLSLALKPNSKRAKLFWIDGFCVYSRESLNRALSDSAMQAVQGLEWGYKTGRFSVEVEMMLRKLSFSKAIDLVVWLSAAALPTGRKSVTQQETVDFVNKWAELVLRYGA